MLRFVQYYGRYQGMRQQVDGLPGWGRVLLVIAAVPGVLLLGLSLLAVAVSILALLLLTVPAYKLVTAVSAAFGPRRRREVYVGEEVIEEAGGARVEPPPAAHRPPGARRHVDVKIIEPEPAEGSRAQQAG